MTIEFLHPTAEPSVYGAREVLLAPLRALVRYY
jgi:hypothetical protein